MSEHRDLPELSDASEDASLDVPDLVSEPEVGAPPTAEAVGEAKHPAVAELADLTDRYLRLAADYDNFRKRATRERGELQTRAQADLARRLLDALDDLGRVAHLDPATTAAADVIAGVELVERKLLRELVAAGLEPVATPDVPFDPECHEAITTMPAASEAEDHTVAAVFQVGYRFNGTLLRPARVQVRIWTAPASS
jgi:molecular chaperone GrpE